MKFSKEHIEDVKNNYNTDIVTELEETLANELANSINTDIINGIRRDSLMENVKIKIRQVRRVSKINDIINS